MRVSAGAAAGLLVTLALAGCGTGATKASSGATKASSGATKASSGATTRSADTTDAATTGTGSGTATASGTDTAPAGTGTETSQTSATTQSATSVRGGGHKGQKGNGLPAAPDGLAQTAGYVTYERCRGTCTGAVPAALRRPLKLPAADGGPCPITLNARPASTGKASGGVGFRGVSGSQWKIAEVTWRVPASYAGPLLIRGEMVGGGALGFGTGVVPYDELQLLDAGQGAPRVVGGGRAWITYTRVRSGGCYAYQVDGSGFSEVVVFRAVA